MPSGCWACSVALAQPSARGRIRITLARLAGRRRSDTTRTFEGGNLKHAHIRSVAAIALIAAALSGQSEAQTLYRCGKQYQDRPCDAGQQGRAVGNATSQSAGGTTDADCSRRGERALKIIWAREGGTTVDAALSQSGGGDERRLVEEVYQKRGSASQIRAAIEVDCVAQKERDAQAAAMVKALGLPQNSQSGQPQPAQPPAEDPQAAEARRQRLAAEDQAARKKETCARLNGDMQRNLAAQRSGGGIATMEKLNEQRRDIARRMSDAGC